MVVALKITKVKIPFYNLKNGVALFDPFTSLSSYYKSFKADSAPPGELKQPTLGYDNGLGSYAV